MHKIELINKNSKSGFEIECGVKMISGGKNPCNYSKHYFSVIGNGNIYHTKDIHKKHKGPNLIMKNQTGKDFSFTESMLTNVLVFKPEAEFFSAKGNC